MVNLESCLGGDPKATIVQMRAFLIVRLGQATMDIPWYRPIAKAQLWMGLRREISAFSAWELKQDEKAANSAQEANRAHSRGMDMTERETATGVSNTAVEAAGRTHKKQVAIIDTLEAFLVTLLIGVGLVMVIIAAYFTSQLGTLYDLEHSPAAMLGYVIGIYGVAGASYLATGAWIFRGLWDSAQKPKRKGGTE